MKEELKAILKERFNIDIWFSDFDIDCTNIYFDKSKVIGDTILRVLRSLHISVYDVPESYEKTVYDDEVAVISIEIIN